MRSAVSAGRRRTLSPPRPGTCPQAGHLGLLPLAGDWIVVCPGRQRTASRLAFLLDVAILFGALILISWATVLGSVYHAGPEIGPSAVTGLAYPISDIVMAVMAVLLVGRTTGSTRLSLLLVSAGVFANLLTDSASAYLTTVTSSGLEPLLGTGWVVGF